MREHKFYTDIVCLIISLGGLLLGISANVSGASMYFVDYFGLQTGSFAEGLSVSMTMLATFIGNFFAGNICDRTGRKRALVLAAILFSFCTLGSAMSRDYVFFLVSRFVGGLGIGISLLVVPLYISEIAPASRRGFLVSFNQLNIGLGYLLAYLCNSLINGSVSDIDLRWRLMLGAGFIFPLVYLVGLAFVPESPAWLVRHGRSDKALEIAGKTGADLPENSSDTGGLPYRSQWRLLFSRKMKLVVAIAFSIAFFQMAGGINVVLFYTPKLLEMGGFSSADSFVQSNLVGIFMVIMTIVSMVLIDRTGRKPLLIAGTSVMILAFAVIAFSFYSSRQGQMTETSSAIILIAMLAVVAGFSVSLGPITWAYLSEVFPYQVKGLGISLAGMFNGIVSFAVTTLFPMEVEHIGSGNTFLIYMILMIACLVCIMTFYPETKGRSLAEIEKELVRTMPRRSVIVDEV